MLASWLRERDQQRIQEAEERGRIIGLEQAREEGRREAREEGRREGRKKADQEWRDWYERYQVAQQEGREFNEPPPDRPGKGND